MIQYFGIQDDGKLIEHYSTKSINPNDVNAMLNSLKNRPTASKVINRLRVNNLSVYYFTQGTYLFFVATLEEKKEQRVHKYLGTVAEMFYEEYDERHFKHVLKYAVEEINRVERHPEGVVVMSDESDNLIGRVEKLKTERPKPPARSFSRANKVTLGLFALAMVLIYLYLRG